MEPFFRWHPKKARSNFVKHGVSFEEAASVFRDTLSVTIRLPTLCTRARTIDL